MGFNEEAKKAYLDYKIAEKKWEDIKAQLKAVGDDCGGFFNLQNVIKFTKPKSEKLLVDFGERNRLFNRDDIFETKIKSFTQIKKYVPETKELELKELFKTEHQLKISKAKEA